MIRTMLVSVAVFVAATACATSEPRSEFTCESVQDARDVREQLAAARSPLQSAATPQQALEIAKAQYAVLGEVRATAAGVDPEGMADVRLECLVVAADAAIYQAFLPLAERPDRDVLHADAAAEFAKQAVDLCAALSASGQVDAVVAERCVLAHVIGLAAPVQLVENQLGDAFTGEAPETTAAEWARLTTLIRELASGSATWARTRGDIDALTPEAAAGLADFDETYLRRPVCDLRVQGSRLRNLPPTDETEAAREGFVRAFAGYVGGAVAGLGLALDGEGAQACAADAASGDCQLAREGRLVRYCEG